ncbi:MAG: SH3 domain-containing protein [Geobacteraceae bacterium]|nr:SH3 domain-containing protein [Geobacteraceae bacterium]
MKKTMVIGILGFGVLLFFVWIMPWITVSAMNVEQIPTGSIATVTGTQVGALATVLQNEQGFANLRAGPNTLGYDVVGVLLVGQQVPALGRSPGGSWIMVAYPGAPGGAAWVFSDLVEVKGSLPIVQPPPTVTPQTTPTLDPTLVAQFEVDIQPTRLPTYTAPPPMVLPTLGSDVPQTLSGRIPVALLIIGLGVLGIFGLLISFLRNR